MEIQIDLQDFFCLIMQSFNKDESVNLNNSYIYLGTCFQRVLTIFKIKNVLKRRRECGTYLATARRHHRRLKMMKKDE